MVPWLVLVALSLAPTGRQAREQGSMFGFSLASIADVDRDGVRDLAVGDPFAAEWRGEVAVLSGRSGRLIRLFVSNGDRVAFGWEIEAAPTSSTNVRWAVAAAGMGARQPYVDVFEGSECRPITRLEAPRLEHTFGHRVAFSADKTVVVLASALGGRDHDGTEGEWWVSAWSVPNGVRLWGRSAGIRSKARPPRFWLDPLVGRDSESGFVMIGSLGVEAKPGIVRLDARTGDTVSQANPILGRVDPSSLALLHADADGIPDLLRGYASDSGEASGPVVLTFGATSRAIRRHMGQHPGWGANVAALGDLDCDGIDDYAIASFGVFEPGIVRVHSGADGTLLHNWIADPERIGHQQFGRSLRGVDDLDGDRVRDVVVGSTNPFAPGEGGSVWAFSGRTGDVIWWTGR